MTQRESTCQINAQGSPRARSQVQCNSQSTHQVNFEIKDGLGDSNPRGMSILGSEAMDDSSDMPMPFAVRLIEEFEDSGSIQRETRHT